MLICTVLSTIHTFFLKLFDCQVRIWLSGMRTSYHPNFRPGVCVLASEYFSQANVLMPSCSHFISTLITGLTCGHLILTFTSASALFPVSGCDRGLPMSPSDHLKIIFPALASDLTAAVRASTPIIRILRAATALPNIC